MACILHTIICFGDTTYIIVFSKRCAPIPESRRRKVDLKFVKSSHLPIFSINHRHNIPAKLINHSRFHGLLTCLFYMTPDVNKQTTGNSSGANVSSTEILLNQKRSSMAPYCVNVVSSIHDSQFLPLSYHQSIEKWTVWLFSYTLEFLTLVD